MIAARLNVGLEGFGSAGDLNSKLGSIVNGPINEVDYFGHSYDSLCLLNYGELWTNATSATDVWGLKDFGGLRSLLPAGFKFLSFGCNQANPNGLCQGIASLGFAAFGSVGKTDYAKMTGYAPASEGSYKWFRGRH